MVVRCHYFVYKQRAEDRVLQAVVRMTETIKKELGSLSQVIDQRLTHTLGKGIRHADIASLIGDIDGADLDRDAKAVIDEELEAARERQDEVRENRDVLQKLLQASKDWVGLNDAHFRAAISCGLELLKVAPLKEIVPGRFEFPAVDEREGGDASWADTLSDSSPTSAPFPSACPRTRRSTTTSTRCSPIRPCSTGMKPISFRPTTRAEKTSKSA